MTTPAQLELRTACAAPILRNISLRLPPGAVTAIIGPNGSGKSTLLRLLAGGLAPSHGQALLDGRPTASFGAAELAQRRAVLSQTCAVVPGFTVAELAALGARPDRRAPIERILAELDLTALAGRQTQLLSGGERQRAHLARVLVQAAAATRDGPPALLLDEPLSAQDLRHQGRIVALARRHAAAGGAVAIVLHDLNAALRVADHVMALRDGAAIAWGAAAEVLAEATLARIFDVPVRRHRTDEGELFNAIGPVPVANPPFANTKE